MRFVCLTMLVVLCAGCAARPSTGLPSTPDKVINATNIDLYRIGVGDVLNIVVRKADDLSVSGPVRPDGRISVPLIGDMTAVGNTAEELATAIEQALQAYLRSAEVTVVISDPVSSEYLGRVRITGSVKQPLSLPHRQGMTVLDLVLQAGGLTPYAKANNATLYRRINGKVEAYPIRLDDILKKGLIDTNFMLVPSDILTVPERVF